MGEFINDSRFFVSVYEHRIIDFIFGQALVFKERLIENESSECKYAEDEGLLVYFEFLASNGTEWMIEQGYMNDEFILIYDREFDYLLASSSSNHKAGLNKKSSICGVVDLLAMRLCEDFKVA